MRQLTEQEMKSFDFETRNNEQYELGRSVYVGDVRASTKKIDGAIVLDTENLSKLNDARPDSEQLAAVYFVMWNMLHVDDFYAFLQTEDADFVSKLMDENPNAAADDAGVSR